MFLQDFEFMILKKHVLLLYFVVYKKTTWPFWTILLPQWAFPELLSGWCT